MRFSYTFLLVTMILFPAYNSWGCIMDAPLVAEDDINYPPADMIAFKGIIKKVSPEPPFIHKPHGGFKLELKITKVLQGDILVGNILVIQYGGCHNLPANVGDEINVLAIKNEKTGWYAPQFWRRSNDSRNKKN